MNRTRWEHDDIQRPAIRTTVSPGRVHLLHTMQDAILVCVLCVAALAASAVAALMAYAVLLALVGWLGR